MRKAKFLTFALRKRKWSLGRVFGAENSEKTMYDFEGPFKYNDVLPEWLVPNTREKPWTALKYVKIKWSLGRVASPE